MEDDVVWCVVGVVVYGECFVVDLYCVVVF